MTKSRDPMLIFYFFFFQRLNQRRRQIAVPLCFFWLFVRQGAMRVKQPTDRETYLALTVSSRRGDWSIPARPEGSKDHRCSRGLPRSPETLMNPRSPAPHLPSTTDPSLPFAVCSGDRLSSTPAPPNPHHRDGASFVGCVPC